jgi:hypothetical protein
MIPMRSLGSPSDRTYPVNTNVLGPQTESQKTLSEALRLNASSVRRVSLWRRRGAD